MSIIIGLMQYSLFRQKKLVESFGERGAEPPTTVRKDEIIMACEHIHLLIPVYIYVGLSSKGKIKVAVE